MMCRKSTSPTENLSQKKQSEPSSRALKHIKDHNHQNKMHVPEDKRVLRKRITGPLVTN